MIPQPNATWSAGDRPPTRARLRRSLPVRGRDGAGTVHASILILRKAVSGRARGTSGTLDGTNVPIAISTLTEMSDESAIIHAGVAPFGV
jgi:hypothetical protein